MNTILKGALSRYYFMAIISCNKNSNGYSTTPPQQTPQATVASAAGDSVEMVGTINQFRSLPEDSLNTTTGKITGRREISREDVPSTFINNNNFPFDFFQQYQCYKSFCT